jgi:hypothetical protein
MLNIRPWIFLVIACGGKSVVSTEGATPFDQECASREPLRQVLWGDLHAHSSWSFDAGAYGSQLTTADAYEYAKGAVVSLPDETGSLTRDVSIDRPLDFLGMTEHGEFLGEIKICTDDSWAGYTSETCKDWRDLTQANGAFSFGVLMADSTPERFEDVCGAGSDCEDAARERWAEIQAIANDADDKTSGCAFTAFIAYEYTNTRDVSNLHRNVIFRSDTVPDLPVTHFEAPSPVQLWTALDEACTGECDVVTLPHNSNLSNGQLFTPDYEGAPNEAEVAQLRARMEPVGEIFQHKGDSECRAGFDGISAESECGFEKLRPPDDDACGDTPGAGGMRLWGCVHRLDFLRNVLLEGLSEQRRLGVNPYRLGFIGSTDTHNGTPGHVDSVNFQGHVGIVDASPEGRLGAGTTTHDTLENNPGGLAAVWAEDNSRTSIFDAIRRRETYATSGPRIALRFFGGEALSPTLCESDDRIEQADTTGTPMGGSIASASTFFVEAHADQTPLSQLQIIKGWIDEDGITHSEVIHIAGESEPTGSVDLSTCETNPGGTERLCTVWTDPSPMTQGFYYARVLEDPTCRWSQRECNRFEPEERPDGCTGSHVEQAVVQRAWSSPIWVGQ